MKEKNKIRTGESAGTPGISGKVWNGMRNALKVFRKRWRFFLIVFMLVFLALCGYHYFVNKHTASTVLSLDYEEASKGLTPNRTRFNIFEIQGGEVMERLIEYAGLEDLVCCGVYSQRGYGRKNRGRYAFTSLQSVSRVLRGALRIQSLHPVF